MVRWICAGLLCATFLSCREVIDYESLTSIQGYQLNGTLTTPNGIPIEDADVLLAYNYDYVSDVPRDTQQVYVTKPMSLVDVAVYTTKYEFVRQIFFDYRTTGPVPRFYWNGRDRLGNVVASGKYLIRYAVDTTVVKYVPWIIDGERTAITDARGRFTFSGSELPVGSVFDIYDNTNLYIGTYSVTPEIDVRFEKLTQSTTYTQIGIVQNSITSRTFVLQ